MVKWLLNIAFIMLAGFLFVLFIRDIKFKWDFQTDVSYIENTNELYTRYIDEFIEALEDNGMNYRSFSDIKISFSHKQKNKGLSPLGVCYLNNSLFDNNIYIFIDKKYIRNNRKKLATTLWHELAHCLLNIKHNSSVIGDVPVSIMHTNSYNDDYVYFNKKFYLRKLKYEINEKENLIYTSKILWNLNKIINIDKINSLYPSKNEYFSKNNLTKVFL